MSKEEGYVYVVETCNALKLGFSRNPEKRFKQLERWSGELVPIFHVAASRSMEQQLHRILKAKGVWLGNEWYDIQYREDILKTILESLALFKVI